MWVGHQGLPASATAHRTPHTGDRTASRSVGARCCCSGPVGGMRSQLDHPVLSRVHSRWVDDT
eukprot:7308550-Prymnesium_polylepis.2